jgi:hypothetical protein
MSSPHQLFQTVLFRVAKSIATISTLQHAVDINIPKRRLLCHLNATYHVPNIGFTVFLCFLSELQRALRSALLCQLQMIKWRDLNRRCPEFIDVETNSCEWICHERLTMVAVEFWYRHIWRRASASIAVQPVAWSVLLNVVFTFTGATRCGILIHGLMPSKKLLFNLLFHYHVVLFLCESLDWMDLVNIFIMYELAFIAISALAWCLLMPLFAHFCFVVFVETLRWWLYY